MEERIIDDEYGRGIKLKKTKDGYVDVTDAALEEGLVEDGETEDGEEISFEFPVFDTDADDEDLVGLTPEEALALRKKKEAEAQAKKDEYERLCKEGEKLLETGSFKAAELKFERALSLDEKATEASVGYWRAKTADFDDADALVSEYADEGVENLEFDLGYEAVEQIKAKYHDQFVLRYEQLSAEETQLEEKVLSAQAARRVVLKERVKKTSVFFAVSALLATVALVFTVWFGMMNFTTPDTAYILPTVISAAAFLALFVFFGVCTNKFVNACRMRRSNERLSSTRDGARLLEIRDYKELYAYLVG